MKAKVPKCHSPAIQASSAKSFNPTLTLYDQPIHFIGTKAIRFLGSTIQNSHTIKSQLALKLNPCLRRSTKFLSPPPRSSCFTVQPYVRD